MMPLTTGLAMHYVSCLGCCAPFTGGGGAGSPSNTIWPGLRSTAIPIGIFIHSAICPQQTWVKNGGLCRLLREGKLGPRLTQCRLGSGLPHYQVASWSIEPFGHNRYGPKIGGCTPSGEGELGPHLAQCGLGRDLAPYQVASWSIQPFGHNIYGPKIGELCPLLGEGKLGPHVTQCGQGRGLPACQVASWSVQPFGHNTLTSQTGRTGQTVTTVR